MTTHNLSEFALVTSVNGPDRNNMTEIEIDGNFETRTLDLAAIVGLTGLKHAHHGFHNLRRAWITGEGASQIKVGEHLSYNTDHA